MKLAVAIVCAALSMSEAACTLGPAADDGGTSSSTTTTTTGAPTLGDQCETVITPFCQLLPGCAINASLADCINNFMPLCCTGSACSAASTVSQSTVTTCAETNATLDCNTVVNTTNPAACLTSS